MSPRWWCLRGDVVIKILDEYKVHAAHAGSGGCRGSMTQRVG
jgi:hypothetical protein